MNFLEKVKQNQAERERQAQNMDYFSYIKNIERYDYNLCRVKLFIVKELEKKIIEEGEELIELKMPSWIEMAKKIHCNPKTIGRVYNRLREEDWLEPIPTKTLRYKGDMIVVDIELARTWRALYKNATVKTVKRGSTYSI